MMHLSGMRLLLTVLVSLVAVQNAAAFTEALDDIWSLLFDSSSSESDSMEMINLHTKNATIKVDCAVPCTLNVVCNNCNTMTSNMNPSDASTSTTVPNGGGGTVPTSASVTTSAPTATTTTVPSSSTVDSSSPTTTDASP